MFRTVPQRAVLATGLVGAAFLVPTAGPAAAAPERSITIAKNFHATFGGGTTARISTHGNVVDYLSPDSPLAGRYEHIGVGDIGEGYVLCYTGPAGTVRAWDTGVSESGFGPATTTAQTAKSITISRQTNDGRLTLVQLITFNGTNRSVLIKMTLRNNTASPVPNVVLRRQVDFDVDTGGADGWAGFQSWHATTTRTTSFAWSEPAAAPGDKDAHAMQLKFMGASSTGLAHNAYTTTQILDNTCEADSRRPGVPAFGDFGDTQLLRIGTVPSNGSQFATVEYSRF